MLLDIMSASWKASRFKSHLTGAWPIWACKIHSVAQDKTTLYADSDESEADSIFKSLCRNRSISMDKKCVRYNVVPVLHSSGWCLSLILQLSPMSAKILLWPPYGYRETGSSQIGWEKYLIFKGKNSVPSTYLGRQIWEEIIPISESISQE